jgi:hypothetical protein
MRTPLRLSSKKLNGAEGMAFAPDEGHMAEKPRKSKPGPRVKFIKFTISGDSGWPTFVR